jgi:hypothetical protein
MRILRSAVIASVLLAAPLQPAFGQGAPPTKAPPQAAAPPAASPKASAPPVAPASGSAAASAQAAAPQYEISTEVDAAMTEKAQALFKEGNAFFRDAKYAQAQASYRAAWALDLRSAKAVTNLGMTELELKKYRDAAEHLTIAVRLMEDSDRKKPRAVSALAQARTQVAAITLKIGVDGVGVDGVEIVQMDSGKSYTTPLTDPIFIDPGKVSFRIRREGYESQEKVFDLKAGEEASADITLARPASYGGPSGTTTATAPTSTAAPRSKVPAFVLGGLGIAGLVAGGALIGVAVGTPASIDAKLPLGPNGQSLCKRTAHAGEDPVCADLRATAQSGSTMGNVGVGLLVGGGVLVAAAAVYLLVPSNKTAADNKRSSRVVPVVSNEGGGLLWAGSF